MSASTSSEEMFHRINDERDRSMGIGVINDPYPTYHALQAQCPVQDGTMSSKFGFVGGDGLLFPDSRHVTVTGFSEVQEVLKDPETYSSAWYDPQFIPTIGRSIINMEPSEHLRHRLILQRPFSKAEMEGRWRTEYIEPACHHYIDRIAGLGRADLFDEFCVCVPRHVIALALGLPVEDLPWFHAVALQLTAGTTHPEDALKAAREIEDRLRPLVEERRRHPGDDLISIIVNGRVKDDDGEEHGLDDDEVLTFCKALLPAGANTTYRSLGLLLAKLFSQPSDLERIREDRALIPDCVEELVRIEHSAALIGRVCTRDTELAGQPIGAGDIVLLSLGAANHDPDRWSEPEAFIPDRAVIPNAAFGWGFHRCLGVHLARTELVCGLNALLDRLPGLRPDPDAPPAQISGLVLRSPDHVWAVWDKAD